MSLTWITDEPVIGCPEEEETEGQGRVGSFDEEKKKKKKLSKTKMTKQQQQQNQKSWHTLVKNNKQGD